MNKKYICVAGNLKTLPFPTFKEAETFSQKWKGQFSLFEDIKIMGVEE